MFKTDYKIFSLIMFFVLTISSSAYAVNIGRNVYGIYSEVYAGNNIYNSGQSDPSDIDAIEIELWSNQSMTSSTSTSEFIEGDKSFRLYAGPKRIYLYGGGGFHTKNSDGYKDMSSYNGGSIKLYVKTADEKMANFKVGYKTGSVSADEHYYTIDSLKDPSVSNIADGQWHELTIPLPSSGLETITYAFLFKLEEADYEVGNSIYIDNIRWLKPTTGSFSMVLKDVGTDAVSSDQNKITWNEGVFRAGWKVAQQYVSFDLDEEIDSRYLKTWKFKIYSKNETGLKPYQGSTPYTDEGNLSLCWRMADAVLATSSTDKGTTLIEQIVIDNNYHLYDAGDTSIDDPTGWWPWLFMLGEDGDLTTDYSTIWSHNGLHIAENDTGYKYNVGTPNLYIGANFDSACAGLKYQADIVIKFENE
ncbi:MAG: hypothetical protein II816_01935 [Elusimicrobia bacterium]|nr:hypothetical protein [Elusimicrobiota bacterium]